MLAESKKLEEKINSIQSQLKNYPKGTMFCTHNGKYSKWYYNNTKEQIYIPKKERKFAEKLAAKKYLSYLLEDLTNEKRAIDFYLRHHRKDVGKAENLLTNKSEYQELLIPFFKPMNQELKEWMESPYNRNSQFPKQLIYKTNAGTYVRSKSEAIISMYLTINRIPYRYECSLMLGDIVLFPDFTIRHPNTGETIYWEHFGMMDSEKYYRNVSSKLELYVSNGIIPSINLITTYETKEKPLKIDMVERIIEYYFS